MPTSPYSNGEYTVGWVCALPIELVAARGMLDEQHGDPQTTPGNPDNNTYVLGSIGKHKIVIACLPRAQCGSMTAAVVAKDMLHTFQQIRFGLMVGIGAGIPSYDPDEDIQDIRLGDVVVGSDKQNGGVVLYDFGQILGDGSFKAMYALNQPPRSLRTALSRLESEHMLRGSQVSAYVDQMLEKHPPLRCNGWGRPDESTDNLFHSGYRHVEGNNCSNCDISQTIDRDDYNRRANTPAIHYGTIATGSAVIRHAPTRDKIKLEHRAICIEMGAAGLMNFFPCVVIRGIADYNDSHTNDIWRNYAAATSAAFAKELLGVVVAKEVQSERRANEVLHRGYSRQHDIIRKRARGTGTWFLESTKFRTWLKQGRQTLFCPGIPGSGKTMMAALAVEYLQSLFVNDSDAHVLYLFCSYQPQQDQDAESLMLCLLRQLVSGQERIPPHINSMFRKHNRQRTRPSLSEISEAFLAAAKITSKAFVIIDALDELYAADYTGCHRLIEQMAHLQKHAALDFMVTSRFNMDIMSHLLDIQELEIHAQPNDVLCYINERIPFLKAKVADNADIEEAIRESVANAADGIFLQAHLYMDHLMNKPSIGHLKRALRELPKGSIALAETYHKAISRIDHQSKDLQALARQTLPWLAYSQRALTSQELQHALATHPGTTELDKDYMPSISLVVSSCAGLAVWDTGDNIVRLAHYTVQEFLIEQGVLPGAEEYIAETCLTYLSFKTLALPSSTLELENDNDETKRHHLTTSESDYPLYSYSATYWQHHAANATANANATCAETETLISRFSRFTPSHLSRNSS
ncbi:hypothetical protein BJY04DRAFT_230933 [Aspergillus karnatakaensis]|uniref:uncharacterized protein n=1 Tax=Aspergillus karnatakaensis TaxID=1810916 RepID=UPI003CCCA9A0